MTERSDREKFARKNDIIDAAEKLFKEKGFEGASMDDIAAAAEFTKRTVYSYFINKEDLFFAVTLRFFRQLLDDFETAARSIEKGFDKIMVSADQYYRFYLERKEDFKIITYARAIHTNEKESPHHQEMVALQGRMINQIMGAIETGKKDGSVRQDIDPLKAAFYLMGTSVALLEMFVNNEPAMEETLGIGGNDFIRYSFGLIGDSIRAR